MMGGDLPTASSASVDVSLADVCAFLEQEAHHFHFVLEGREGREKGKGKWVGSDGEGGCCGKRTVGPQAIQEGTEGRKEGSVRKKED